MYLIKYPTAGLDAQWIAYCKNCDDYTLCVSVNGFFNGSFQHCYSCGDRTKISGFSYKDILRMLTSSFTHWLKFPKYPYNWHMLSETKRWKIIGGYK